MTIFENEIDDLDLDDIEETDTERTLADHGFAVRDLSEVADWLDDHTSRPHTTGEWVEYHRIKRVHHKGCQRLARTYSDLYAMRLYAADVQAAWAKVAGDHETGGKLATQSTERMAALMALPHGTNRLADAVAGAR